MWFMVIEFCIEIGPESTHFYKSADARASSPKKLTTNETNLACQISLYFLLASLKSHPTWDTPKN